MRRPRRLPSGTLRILLDHNIDRRLGPALTGHLVRTARQERLDECVDAVMLDRAQHSFDILITADQGLVRQNRIDRLDLAVILVMPRRNVRAELLPLVPRILAAVEGVGAGDVVRIAPE